MFSPFLLLSHPQGAPLMDQRVEIHGTSRADMNGKCGVATDFHPMGGPSGDRTTWRYTVKLDGGEAFKVKPANLRAEGAGGVRAVAPATVHYTSIACSLAEATGGLVAKLTPSCLHVYCDALSYKSKHHNIHVCVI